jgi:hypothetical protein
MQRINIFLSHSVHKEADKQIMNQLIQLLEEAGFYVYSDRKRLKVGDCWRNKLYSAICSCHAAVVLVTQEALDTAKYPWVFKECSMFTMLKYANSQFPIIPIRMTGVTIEDIDKSPFKALQLNEIMAGSYEDLKTVMDIIKSKLSEPEYSDEPFYYHHKRIADSLPSSDKELVRKAIEELDSDEDRWNPTYKVIHFNLARILLSLSATKLIDALPGSLQGILYNLGEQRSRHLIDNLAPFWLDLTAIAEMENEIQSDQERILRNLDDLSKDEGYIRKSFGINTQDELVAKMYVRHAGYLKKLPYNIIGPPDNVSSRDIEDYEKHILAGINRSLGRKLDRPLDKSALKIVAEHPTFIILPYDTEKKVVQALREKFKPFIFIVLTGNDDITQWDLPNFVMLEPSLKEETEYQINTFYGTVMFEVTSILNN